MKLTKFWLLELVWYSKNINRQQCFDYPLAAEAEIPNNVLE